MKDPRLTVLLTLKGRSRHTLRWLWHANRTHFPFKIYIADGEVREPLANWLEDKKRFPNLDYKYVRYDDRSYADYYRKCADAASRVETPYVMMADNDDFIFPEGIKSCLDFLDSQPDYVCAQGEMGGFSLYPEEGMSDAVMGGVGKLAFRYTSAFAPKTVAQSAALERLRSHIREYYPTYYAITRRSTLEKITTELVDINFNSLQLHELYWSYRTMTLGKVHADSSFMICLRQHATSGGRVRRDLVEMILEPQYNHELDVMLGKLAEEAPDGKKEELRQAFAGYMESVLRQKHTAKLMKSSNRVRSLLKRKWDPKGEKAFFSQARTSIEDAAALKQSLCEVERTLGAPELRALLQEYQQEMI